MTYTTTDRAQTIYNAIVDVFDYNSTSECVTPLSLALKQVERVPLKSGKVLVACAGIGTYVLACILEGIPPQNITAVEINPSYARLGSGIFSRFGVTYVTADFLTYQSTMQFDVIIGNPPYHKNKYSDFYVCFLRKVEEFLKPGGYFSYLMPAKGVNPGSRARPVLKSLGWSRVEVGVEKYFPNIGTVIAEYSGVKGSNPHVVEAVVNGEVYPVLDDTVLPLTDGDPLTVSLTRKIFAHSDKMPYTRREAPNNDYVYVSRMVGTWHPSKPKGGRYALQATVNTSRSKPDGGFVSCASREEADKVQWLVTRSLVMRFAINQCGKAAFIPPLFWSLSPDLRSCSNDKETFDLLGLTPDEVSYLKSWESAAYAR
jgi:SAM-dependent methyltransferase